MNGVVDSVKAGNLGILGNAELVLTGTSLGGSTLLQIGLRVPYALAQQLGKLSCMLSLLKSVALESLGNLRIALTVSLTRHGQIHTHLAALAVEVVAQVVNHLL